MVLLSPESFVGHTADQLSHTAQAPSSVPPGFSTTNPSGITAAYSSPPGIPATYPGPAQVPAIYSNPPVVPATYSNPPGIPATYSSPPGIPMSKPVTEQSWADYQQMMAPAKSAPPPGFQPQKPPQPHITPERPISNSTTGSQELSNAHANINQSYGGQCKTPEKTTNIPNSQEERENLHDANSVFANVCKSLYGTKSLSSTHVPITHDFFPDFARVEQKQEPVVKYNECLGGPRNMAQDYSTANGKGNVSQVENRSELESTSESEAPSEASNYVDQADDYDLEFPTLANEKKGRKDLIEKAMIRNATAKEVKVRPFGPYAQKCLVCQSTGHRTFECPKKNRNEFFQH